MDINSIPVITIDGPSASGKGTIAQLVAKKLGFHYLDSGALYRLVALKALQADINISDENKLAKIAATLDVFFENDQIYLLLQANFLNEFRHSDEVISHFVESWLHLHYGHGYFTHRSHSPEIEHLFRVNYILTRLQGQFCANHLIGC